MRRPEHESACRSKAMRLRCGVQPSAPTVSASLLLLTTERRGSGTRRRGSDRRVAQRPRRCGEKRGVQPRRPTPRHRVFGRRRRGSGMRRPASRSAKPLKGHEGGVYSAAFSPNGKRIVTASDDGTARVWDVATGQPIGGSLNGRLGTVNLAVFSPDSKRIVTASLDSTAQFGTPRAASRSASRSRAMTGGVNSAAFSPDGKRIVTASEDKTARLWDAATGQPIGAPLKGHDKAVTPRRSAPTASASSPRLGTERRGFGTSGRQADRRAAQRT